MSRKNVVHLFEKYADTYQPYIGPTLKKLALDSTLNHTIIAYHNSTAKGIKVLPSYTNRKLAERFYRLFPRFKDLTYFEIYCLRHQIDIIHIQQSYLFTKVLNFLTETTKTPKVIVTLRGADLYIKANYIDKWKNFFQNEAHYVSAFVVMSNDQKNLLIKKWGIDASLIHIIPISFGEKFKISPKQPNKRSIKLFSAFRLCWEKNLDANLRTIALLDQMGCSVQYDIYGTGNHLGELHFLIEKYGIGHLVEHKGFLENSLLKKAIIEYDFVIQLSKSESFGMSVVEAQAHGIPAITSNVGGLPDIVEHGKTGYTVEHYDAEQAAKYILDLWNNPELYESFSLNAIEKSQNSFNTNKERIALASLYEKLLKKTD